MSLKAKLEAVIYAAEEPVPVAQLAILFGNEALEWKAEQEAARAAEEARNTEAAAAEPAELPLETGEQAGTTESADAAVESAEAQADGGTGGAEAADDPAAAEAEARRLARQRDREVRAILREILDEIIASYASDERGVEIREIAGGYRMATKPECHDAVRMFVKSLKPALKLSLPALETLAVIAYKQPITAPEVNEIRGVDSSGVFGSLLARKLIATAGRKQVIGRPILYKTTKEFLLRFGLKDLSELPSMEEFEKMAASELEEVEPGAPETGASPSAEAAAIESEAPSMEAESLDAEAKTAAPETAEAAGDEAQETAPESAPEPTAESPEPQSESNPSETAPVNAEPGTK